MFRLGASVSTSPDVARPLSERVACAGYAAMAYWFYRWDWGEAVALDGLLAADQAFGFPAGTDFVVAEATRWVRADTGATPNVMGPALAVLDLLEQGRLDERDVDAAWALVGRVADTVVEADRKIGGFAPEMDRRVLFVDSLYGVPELLVRLGDHRASDELVRTATELAVGHCAALQREDGLFSHAADLDGVESVAIPWGRGNGWAVLGLSRLLAALGPARSHAALLAAYRRLLEALHTRQDAGGSWHNLVDEPRSYPESSTTAMVAASPLPEGYQDMGNAAWAYVADRIDPSGHLQGVSYRPGVNSDRSRYEHTPVTGSYPWGQGPYLLAACRHPIESEES